MKLRHIFSIEVLLVASMASAADYTWTGGAGMVSGEDYYEYGTGGNWSENTVPSGSGNVAKIGDQETATKIVWTHSFDGVNYVSNFGDIGSVELGKNVTLTFAAAWNGDTYIDVGAITLGENAHFITTSTGSPNFRNLTAITLGKNASVTLQATGWMNYINDLTINYGTFTQNSVASFIAHDFTDSNMQGHTVSFSGVFDLSGLIGTGTITLGEVRLGQYANKSLFNLDGLTYSGGVEGATASFSLTEEGILQATYNIPALSSSVPEPATATLSLLALAGLAARRRRR